jgi:uncharacterized protein YgiM (DUF1202 family)
MSIAFPQLTSRLRSVSATDVAPIHWPSALIGLGLAVFVVVGVSWLAAPRHPDRPLVAASAVAPAPIATVAPTPIPAPPVATREPEPVVERVKVSFTNGSGVNLRAKAGERSQRLTTMPEGTLLEIVGADETADGLTWRHVRDSAGSSGYVAGKFVARVQQ